MGDSHLDNLLAGNTRGLRESHLSNYLGFIARLENSASKEVRLMAAHVKKDAASFTGGNILAMEREFGISSDSTGYCRRSSPSTGRGSRPGRRWI